MLGARPELPVGGEVGGLANRTPFEFNAVREVFPCCGLGGVTKIDVRCGGFEP